MGSLVEVVQEAPEHHTFAPDVFSSQIGKVVPLKVEGRQIDNCKVVAAVVSEDGSSVNLTLEVPDGLFPAPPMSFDLS